MKIYNNSIQNTQSFNYQNEVTAPSSKTNKKIGIVGLARSGLSVFEFLRNNSDYDLLVYDDAFNVSIELNKNIKEELIKCFVDIKCDSIWNNIDYIVVSPGIPRTHPVFKLNAKKISDIELFYIFMKDQSLLNMDQCLLEGNLDAGQSFNEANKYKIFHYKDNCKRILDVKLPRIFPKFIISVTGTNGKSTIVGKIETILGVPSFGNNGIPIFDYFKILTPAQSNKRILILEISSFQLDLQSDFRSDVAIISNIAEDHLDRYENKHQYIMSKLKIFENMNQEDVGLVNLSDATLQNMLKKNIFSQYKCKVRTIFGKQINRKTELKNKFKSQLGSYCAIERFLYEVTKLYEVGKLDLKTLENVSLKPYYIWPQPKITHVTENTLIALYGASLLLSKIYNSRLDIKFINQIKSHFLKLNLYQNQQFCNQKLGVIKGITFINDSKGTNPYSTAKALHSLEHKLIRVHANINHAKIFLICGGIFKNSSIDPILKFKHLINKMYLYGQDAKLLSSLAESEKINYSICKNLEESFNLAYLEALFENHALEQKETNLCNDDQINYQDINTNHTDIKTHASVSEKIILFSPMCASLDQFQSFKHRGEVFSKLVAKISELNEGISIDK